MKPPVSCQLTGAAASLLFKWKAKCLGQRGGVTGVGGGGWLEEAVGGAIVRGMTQGGRQVLCG